MDDRIRTTDMIVYTSRFGDIHADDDRVITFPKGILGFPKVTDYVLFQPNEDSYFYWLHAIDRPDLAFVITDPSLFVTSYRVPFKPEHMQALGVSSPEQAQVFVIVNKHGQMLTGNLQGPLLVNLSGRIGQQLVLSDRRFTTRVPLVELPSQVEAISA